MAFTPDDAYPLAVQIHTPGSLVASLALASTWSAHPSPSPLDLIGTAADCLSWTDRAAPLLPSRSCPHSLHLSVSLPISLSSTSALGLSSHPPSLLLRVWAQIAKHHFLSCLHWLLQIAQSLQHKRPPFSPLSCRFGLRARVSPQSPAPRSSGPSIAPPTRPTNAPTPSTAPARWSTVSSCHVAPGCSLCSGGGLAVSTVVSTRGGLAVTTVVSTAGRGG